MMATTRKVKTQFSIIYILINSLLSILAICRWYHHKIIALRSRQRGW
jgi:hypothetical protein